ncbi:MAG: 5'-nucleotidase C-terminal domain-containing protein [Prevotella sp.]|nr:5'-nucleotidase C-terminal domain-containing protein [Prevotella sp.]
MKYTFLLLCSTASLVLAACKSHYTLGDVSRQRIVIDSRYDAHPDAQAAAFLAPYKQKVDSVMEPVLGEVARDMAAVRPESNLSNLLPDILVAMSDEYGEKPDFGIYNIGGIRAALVKGKVTYGDVLDVAPFENKICFITLTGEKVLELFSQIAKRGGECVSHGVELVISRDGKLLSARLHGKEIDPTASYRITTIDYVAQGNDGLTAFKSGTDLNSPKEDKNNSRYIIANYFQRMAAQGKVVDAQPEGRIVVKEE